MPNSYLNNLKIIKQELEPFKADLLVVSKNKSIEIIKKIYDLGIRDFAESYAQELNKKVDQAKDLGLNNIRWHFIGAIQTNKFNIISKCFAIHSIGSVRHAQMLNNFIDKPINIYLQINLDENNKRQGFVLKDIKEAIIKIKNLKKLNIVGLMTILPIDSQKTKEYWFEQIKKIKEKILEEKILTKLDLSMGMSDDYKIALKYGANIVRIGRRLFGE